MYMTRTLAQLRKFPELVSQDPEGPNSGYLVIQDEESETYCCFGLCKHETLRQLPFPQNKELSVRYTVGSSELMDVYEHPLFLIPVPNLPLSCNKYYAIVPHGQCKGLAYTCSKEKNMGTCCFFRYIRDVGARPLDPQNVYQQFEIVPDVVLCRPCATFEVKSVASDGFPPLLFQQEEWAMSTKIVHHFTLGSAQGLDCEPRARLPHLSSSDQSGGRVVVGKWYCPFIFVKESGKLRDQVERSMYYEMTLEQRWEPIFSCPNNGGNSVVGNVFLEKEEVFVDGNRGVMNERNAIDGVVWFTSTSRGQMSLGLRVEILDRMKWEQERGGWIGGDEKKANIKIMEEFKQGGEWRSFFCYVLVERFKLKRMDESVAMEYDFKHFHHIKTLWE